MSYITLECMVQLSVICPWVTLCHSSGQGHPRTRWVPCRFVKELDIPHEVKLIDYKGGEHKQPWFLKVGRSAAQQPQQHTNSTRSDMSLIYWISSLLLYDYKILLL